MILRKHPLAEAVLGILFFAAFCLSCRKIPEELPEVPADSEALPVRIISTLPSLTEILFELGLGARVVGVSDFCRYPAETLSIPKIGGYFNPNLERIIELKPDLVLLQPEHTELNRQLTLLKIPILVVGNSSIAEILDSFEKIAVCCGVEEEGVRLRKEAEDGISRLRAQTADYQPVRTMIVIDRDLTQGSVTQCYAAGNDPYFNEILALAGGENVLSGISPVPTISREGIIEANPDVIIDLSSFGFSGDPSNIEERQERERKDWESLGDAVSAVKNGRVYPVTEDFATIPGPRFILFAELLADLLHPK